MTLSVRSKDEINKMRIAGRIAGNTLNCIKKNCKVGTSADELDIIADDFIRSNGAVPAFFNYNGYPANICVSINEEIVHGIPFRKKIIKNGDVVSVDVGVFKDGYYGDTAITFVVGEGTEKIKKLIAATEKALYNGISCAVSGNKIYDISSAIQSTAESNNVSVVRDYTGHGIGDKLHDEPYVYNYVTTFQMRRFSPVLKNGNTLAIEPMFNLGTYKTEVLKDEWTVVTKDRKISAHFEHTIVVNGKTPVILTEGD